MKKRALKLGLLFALLAAGCATTFTGSAYVDDGAEGCQRKCADWGLEFGGMVAMGEYSTACICLKKGATAAAAAATTSSAVGVIMRMRQRQAAQL